MGCKKKRKKKDLVRFVTRKVTMIGPLEFVKIYTIVDIRHLIGQSPK